MMRGVCWLGLGLLACASTPPATHYYQLVVSRPRAPQAPGAQGVLAIEPLAVNAAYATDRIVYRKSPYRLDYYHYHRWSAPPALGLTDYLRQAYAHTGELAQVVLTPSATDATATLSGRIVALEEVNESETRWLGRVALELAVLDAETGQPLWSESFLEEEPLAEQSPEGLARALSTALDRIVKSSSGPIAAALRGRSSAATSIPISPEQIHEQAAGVTDGRRE